jgi:hypothetical protein
MDLVAQSVCIALNAYYTPLGLWGMLWGFIGICLDLYNSHEGMGLKEYTERKEMWIRPIHEGVLIFMLTRHCDETYGLFIQSFVCFTLSKLWWPLEFLHGVFHILTHDAMNALWFAQNRFREEHAMRPFDYPVVAEMFAGMIGVVMLYTVVQCYGKAWKYFDRVLTSLFFAVVSGLSYYTYYDASKLFTYVPFADIPTVAQFQIYSELAYYLGASWIEIYEREWMLLFHHSVSFLVIYYASYFGFAHLLILCLAIFMPSNIPLTISKWARSSGRTTVAKIAFGVFSAMYVVFRMGGFSWFVYTTLFRAVYLEHVSREIYIGMNAIIGLLYGIQWFWLGKIIHIWKTIK